MEETNRFFLVDRLGRQLPRVADRQRQPGGPRRAGCARPPAELALMQAASDITIAAFRHAWPRVREGMTRDDIDAIIGAATRALGGGYDGGLVLVGEATAYPHGTRQVQRGQARQNVLFDCGCDVHGYQSDISRSFVWGADPTAEQRKVWDQMARGQQIAMKAARLGAPAGSVDDAVRAAYTAGAMAPATSFPACRTAPATASAWKGMSRSTSSMAKRRRWPSACAFPTSPESTSPASSASGSRIAST